jgi:hypothetical protein
MSKRILLLALGLLVTHIPMSLAQSSISGDLDLGGDQGFEGASAPQRLLFIRNVHKSGTDGDEVIERNDCWIVKIEPGNTDIFRYFSPTQGAPAKLHSADIGKYAAVGETHYNGFGGSTHPEFLDDDHRAVSYDEAVKILKTSEDCK